MRKFISLTLLALLPLVTSTKGVWAQEPSESLKEVYKNDDAHFFSFNYPSKNAAGEDVVLSSLLIAWMPSKPDATDSIESLHIYSHYTITSEKRSPTSEDNVTDRMLFGMLVGSHYDISFSSKHNFISRCVVIAPDYEGYGVSRDHSHPYLSQRLTAQQVMDAVWYGMTLYQKLIDDKRALAFKSDWRSFAYGFSQGGAVTLAVQRHIEENGLSDKLRFRGSICCDGPYDLIATLRYYIDDNGKSFGTKTDHRQNLCTMPMVLPMIIKGMLDTHPDMQSHRLEDYLSQQFLDTGIMEWLSQKEMTIEDIHKQWYEQLKYGLDAKVRHYSPGQMAELFYSPEKNTVWARLDKLFTPGFYAYIVNVDNHADVPTANGNAWQDAHRAMAENSVATGWQPLHRIQFIHSKGDMVVPYGNYLAFRDAHPEDEDVLYRIEDGSFFSDHKLVGTQFFASLCTTSSYGDYFDWIDESPDVTGMGDAHSFSSCYSDAWLDLSGRHLDARPTAKGIYIHKGRKVAIK